MKLIDLLTPLVLLVDFAYREFARRTDRGACRPAVEAPLQDSVPAEVRVYSGIYVRDDGEC